MKKIRIPKKIKHSFLILPLIWLIGTSVIFDIIPGIFLSSSVSEDITWEIQNFDSTNESNVVFNIQTQIRNNNPIPVIAFNSLTCLYEKGEAIIDNELYTGFSLSPRLHFMIGGFIPLLFIVPGNHICNVGIIFGPFEENLTEIPKGIYTFWVDKGRFYKTFLNVSDSGIEIWSESPPEFWAEMTTSISVFILLFTSVYWFTARKEKSLMIQ